jgi:hypothetical protein
MALKPDNEKHASQISAGTIGRRKGHTFEKTLAQDLSNIAISAKLFISTPNRHLFVGRPATELMRYILANKSIKKVKSIRAYWLGGLATSGEGDASVDRNQQEFRKSKSDVVIDIKPLSGPVIRIGVSVKTCSNHSPTNAQLFFTTASAFCNLLRRNSIPVSNDAETALKMFCGDKGFRPADNAKIKIKLRKSDPDRWFFEELPDKGRRDLEIIFSKYQKQVTKTLLQRAYSDDPLPPEFVLHQTVAYTDIDHCEVAIFSIDELVDLSSKYRGFETSQYLIRKGRFKGDPSTHLAPRFGYIQFQRGGQKQHPTQLQFNLQSGYFYKLPEE